ncbi:hypothetical protein CAAN3_06S05292 [[Candida] anglica]
MGDLSSEDIDTSRTDNNSSSQIETFNGPTSKDQLFSSIPQQSDLSNDTLTDNHKHSHLDSRSIASNQSAYDLHPIEVTAHTLLGGSLDHLNENFQHLNQSQVVLYTRLCQIEERLMAVSAVVDDEETVKISLSRIKGLKKRLLTTVKTLNKVEARVIKIEEKI